MKLKSLALLVFLFPSLVFADSSFFSWITGLKVVPEVKTRTYKVIQKMNGEFQSQLAAAATSTATTTPITATTTPVATSTSATAATAPIQVLEKILMTPKTVAPTVKNGEISVQITKLKSENESLKKSLASLQQKITTLTNENNACLQNAEQLKLQASPKALARIKDLEWLIAGVLNNNYRNKFDADGNKTAEMTISGSFFKTGSGATEFSSLIKEYDGLTGTLLSQTLQKFIDSSSVDELEKFEAFYNYFMATRKFPR